jgi:hypothetical protein
LLAGLSFSSALAIKHLDGSNVFAGDSCDGHELVR